MSDPPHLPDDARHAILAWYAERGRPLAFRRTTDPYAILVSEAMAQQTQAARAAVYWERFMERFPTVRTLADATPADVLRAWAGLGYDRRALALWKAARVIVGSHGGRVPSTVAELQALPGVGPYTARAVAALAYRVPVGAVDVNVRRVLGRIVAGGTDVVPAPILQAIADATVPHDQPGPWTHAVMDVGATVCRSREPRCDACPARPWCRYAAQDRPDAAPSRGRRATRESAAPFTTTNRWLRGRILDHLREAEGDAWVAIPDAIGVHDTAAVAAAARAMAVDGVLELRPDPTHLGSLHARLPLG